MPDTRQTVFLTGATGFLGHYLLAELLKPPATCCRLLVRSPLGGARRRLAALVAELGLSLDALLTAGRVELVEGALPDAMDVAHLRGVDQIVHAAASTTFHNDRNGEPMHTNRDGTQALLDLAERAGVRRFLLVSTAFVCGERTGLVPEGVFQAEPRFCNDYEHSKWEAERRVRAWATDGRVATICRPSILVGDRATGRATTAGGIYVMARATEILARAVEDDPDTDRHHVPLRLRGRPDATANLVPVCWTASRIASIVRTPSQHGGVYHLTNAAPSTFAEIKRWLESYFDVGGGVFTGSSEPLSAPNSYEEAFYAVGDIVGDYFRHDLRFSSCFDRGLSGHRLVDKRHFMACLDYARRTNWGRVRPGEPPDDHMPSTTAAGAALDPRWYFEDFMPARLPDSQVARVEALTTTIRFVITGEQRGQWVCRFNRGKLAEVHRGPQGLPEVFGYEVEYDDFRDLVTGKKSLQAAFFSGRAEVFGNQLMAMKMVPIIGAFLIECPVVEGLFL
ncbi:MAG: SDR family oxidoreductase [Phycisphaerae bacterium]